MEKIFEYPSEPSKTSIPQVVIDFYLGSPAELPKKETIPFVVVSRGYGYWWFNRVYPGQISGEASISTDSRLHLRSVRVMTMSEFRKVFTEQGRGSLIDVGPNASFVVIEIMGNETFQRHLESLS